MTPQRILVVASVPPPVAGQSLATEYLLAALNGEIPVSIVDLSDHLERTGRTGQIARALRLSIRPLQLAIKGRVARGPSTVFYLQVGQSRASMVRDLPFLLIARLLGWRMVGHLHGAAWRSAFDGLGGPLKWMVSRSIAWFETLIVLTPSSAGMFDGLIPPEKVRVVSNAVDPELEKRSNQVVPTLSGYGTVLYLGNLITGKGVETLGNVARLAAHQGENVNFIVAGAGDERLLGDIASARCEYVGPVGLQEKMALLERADVLILLSQLREGQPISVLEGFHFGLPIVATGSGGLADLVNDDSGRVVPSDAPSETLEAILEVLEPGEWKRISDHNRHMAERDFSVEHFSEQMRSTLLEARE